MLHYSCDRCKREIETEERRYIVKVETHAAIDPLAPEEQEDDRDHLLEIQDILESFHDQEVEQLGENPYRRHNYDLCAGCYKDYIRNPLGRELAAQIEFSDN
ncbi:hypothetical protein [Lignipirellula cremea]|uniref:Uncharacterized protein n=1 Tax=Lignipirellula cremea TaxID=2528010 RepID=A0A518DMH3_9BACT|nr:hypothetical protein [Lignipirellula cremea]QDU93044.1 hypothetical protein Pla8534_08190 [Lignipirellula cremea]